MQQAQVRINEVSGLQHLCASNSVGTRECSVLQFATAAQDSLHLCSSSESNTNSSFLQNRQLRLKVSTPVFQQTHRPMDATFALSHSLVILTLFSISIFQEKGPWPLSTQKLN